jgi:hydrogenase-4 membrane subunit HyfE
VITVACAQSCKQIPIWTKRAFASERLVVEWLLVSSIRQAGTGFIELTCVIYAIMAAIGTLVITSEISSTISKCHPIDRDAFDRLLFMKLKMNGLDSAYIPLRLTLT